MEAVKHTRTRENELVHVLAAVTRMATSLYGPGKARKQITDASGDTRFTSDSYQIMNALQSEHAVLAILRDALEQQMQTFGTTLKQVRLRICDVLPGFASAAWTTQLRMLGRVLQNESSSSDANPAEGLTLSMRLAAELLADSSSSLLCNEASFAMDDLMTSRIALGGSEGTTSSCTFDGALIPVDSEYCAQLRRGFQQMRSEETADVLEIRGGIVAIDGEFTLPSSESLVYLREAVVGCASGSAPDSAIVHVVFVNGDVAATTMDSCWRRSFPKEHPHNHARMLCIPVPSHKELVCIAELSGAQIVSSWSEILPLAIGQERIHLRLVEIPTTESVEDSDEDPGSANALLRGSRVCVKLFVNVLRAEHSAGSASSPRLYPFRTLLVRGTTRSEAEELQRQVRKSMHRLRNTLRAGCVLPSSGSFLCACAAELRMQADQAGDGDPHIGDATNGHQSRNADGDAALLLERIVDALSRASATLLQNTGSSQEVATGSEFFDHVARVRIIQNNYMQGIHDVGRSKFYAACHFGGADYCILPSLARAGHHFDEYDSTESAFRKSFRVLELLLRVDDYAINTKQH